MSVFNVEGQTIREPICKLFPKKFCASVPKALFNQPKDDSLLIQSKLLQELYQKYVDGDDEYKKIKPEDDPFYDPPEDVIVGTANVFLQSLSYALDFDDKLAITDYKVSPI